MSCYLRTVVKRQRCFKRKRWVLKNDKSFTCIWKNENNVADSYLCWQTSNQQKHSTERFVYCTVWNSGKGINRAFPWFDRHNFYLLRVSDRLQCDWLQWSIKRRLLNDWVAIKNSPKSCPICSEQLHWVHRKCSWKNGRRSERKVQSINHLHR